MTAVYWIGCLNILGVDFSFVGVKIRWGFCTGAAATEQQYLYRPPVHPSVHTSTSPTCPVNIRLPVQVRSTQLFVNISLLYVCFPSCLGIARISHSGYSCTAGRLAGRASATNSYTINISDGMAVGAYCDPYFISVYLFQALLTCPTLIQVLCLPFVNSAACLQSIVLWIPEPHQWLTGVAATLPAIRRPVQFPQTLLQGSLIERTPVRPPDNRSHRLLPHTPRPYERPLALLLFSGLGACRPPMNLIWMVRGI